MKHYKDPITNELYAYELDGSQDECIKPGLVAITDEEADALREQQRIQHELNNPKVDPAEKLRQFLAANPDVADLIK